MTASAGGSPNRLYVSLGSGAAVRLCLCLLVGVGGGVTLYLGRSQRPTAVAAKAAVEYVLDASPRMDLPGIRVARVGAAGHHHQRTRPALLPRQVADGGHNRFGQRRVGRLPRAQRRDLA